MANGIDMAVYTLEITLMKSEILINSQNLTIDSAINIAYGFSERLDLERLEILQITRREKIWLLWILNIKLLVDSL